MRCRRNGIRAFRYHACPGDIPYDFGSRQMATDTGLRTLTHFNFDCCTCIQIVLMHTKPTGCYLHNSVGSIHIKVLMQTSFTGIIIDAQFGSSSGEAGMSVITDGTVAHSRKHHRHTQFQLGCQVTAQVSILFPADFLRLLAQKYLRFHWFPQGINRRIGNLRRIDQNSVPVNREFLWITHRG